MTETKANNVAAHASGAAALVRSGVLRTLFQMALPMLAGTAAMSVYNLTDTWFVSRLGTLPLAAMGFSFPVIMLLSCIAGGIGTGVTTLASHALGRRAQEDAARIVSQGLVFTMAVSAVMATAGILSMDFIFARLGADAAARRLIGQYMRTWYFGAIFMALPMVGNGILISAGLARSASRLMVLGMLVNVALDPIMIFGLFGFPALGICGAALATVIAQATSTFCLLYLLLCRCRLFVLRRWPFRVYLETIRRVLGFGVPAMLSMMLMPISGAVYTRLLGHFGNAAVAAAGAAGRLEMFAFVVPMALGISLTPFISQNAGAQRLDRILQARNISMSFAFFYGLFIAAAFFAAAPHLARVFSQDPAVCAVLVSYLRMVSFGYGMLEIHRYCGFFLTGLHRPFAATALNVVRTLVFLIPLACLGAWRFGLTGIFAGRLLADVLAGGLGLLWLRQHLRRWAGGQEDGGASRN